MPSARDHTTRRRLPPYGARLREVLSHPATWPTYWGTSPDGHRLTLWVLAGPGAWGEARTWADTSRLYLVAPPGDDPARYDWRMLRGHDPIMLLPSGAVDGSEVRALVGALVRDGVRRVLYLGDRGMTRYLAPGAGEGVRHAA